MTTPHFQAIRRQALAVALNCWQGDEPDRQKLLKAPSTAARTDVERLVDGKNSAPRVNSGSRRPMF